MKSRIPTALLLLLIFFILFTTKSEAELNRYLYPYEISELDWQLLKWTSAWQENEGVAAPFKFDRMEYNRKIKKIEVYLKGLVSQGTKDNLNLSLQKLSNVISLRFDYFDAKKDLRIFYHLASEDKTKVVDIEYSEGVFSSKDMHL